MNDRQTVSHCQNIWEGDTNLKESKPVIFMAINKTGSSSIFSWMESHDIKYCMSRYREKDTLKVALIDEVRSNDLISFTTVRNPWDRAVSSWKYCIDRKGLPRCTFKEYLNIPLNKMTPQQRYHSSAQWPHLVDSNDEVAYLDHIGRFEDLSATCRWLADSVDPGFKYQEDLPHLKKTDRNFYTEYYDEETIELVAQAFHRDIEMFNYKFDD